VLRAAVTAPLMTTGRYGDVPAVDAVATHDPETGALAVFAVNRGTEPIRLDLDLRAFPQHRPGRHVWLAEGATAEPLEQAGGTTVNLPPLSWHALTFEEQQ
jgi:alpha-N-arabinofuranosidase